MAAREKLFRSIEKQKAGEEDDGQAAQGLRLKHLAEMVSSLSPHEAWYLRTALDKVHPPNHVDFCAELPFELAVKILGYLSLQDVMTFRIVSKKWNEIISSKDACMHLIEKHWEPAWLAHKANIRPISSFLDFVNQRKSSRVRRLLGQYTSSWSEIIKVSHNLPEYAYSHGMIAWRSNLAAVCVKALSPRSPTLTITPPQRLSIFKWALSEKYLVYSTIRNTVTATSLDSIADPQTVDPPRSWGKRLPSQILHLSINRGMVGIVTLGHGVYIWPIHSQSGPGVLKCLQNPIPQHVDLPTQCRLHHSIHEINTLRVRQAEVVFHPSDPTCLFVIYHALLSSDSSQDDCHVFIAQKYQDLAFQSTKIYWDPDNPDTNDYSVRIKEMHDGIVGIIAESRDISDLSMMTSIFTFNTYTEQFDVQRYRLGDLVNWRWATNLEAILFWRGQAIVPVMGAVDTGGPSEPTEMYAVPLEHQDDKTPPRTTTPLVVAIENQLGNRSLPRTIPWEVEGCERGSVRAGRNRECIDGDAAFYLFGSHAYPNITMPPRAVKGDDDYLVLFGSRGYTAWSFNKDNPGPVGG